MTKGLFVKPSFDMSLLFLMYIISRHLGPHFYQQNEVFFVRIMENENVLHMVHVDIQVSQTTLQFFHKDKDLLKDILKSHFRGKFQNQKTCKVNKVENSEDGLDRFRVYVSSQNHDDLESLQGKV